MRFKRRRDEFQLFSDDVGSAPYTTIDLEEAGCLHQMFLRSVDRMEKMSPLQRSEVKTPGVTLGSDAKYKGRIILRPTGRIDFFWPPFRDEFDPETLRTHAEEFTAIYQQASVVDRSFSRSLTVAERVKAVYFITGMLSFFMAIFSLAIAFSLYAFSSGGVLIWFQVFLASVAYFMVFAHQHRKHRRELKKAMVKEVPHLVEPIVQLISHTDRKIIEFFLILFMVFFMMGVTFSKCIPEILEFWKKHFTVDIPM